jgi:hypothetical protein
MKPDIKGKSVNQVNHSLLTTSCTTERMAPPTPPSNAAGADFARELADLLEKYTKPSGTPQADVAADDAVCDLPHGRVPVPWVVLGWRRLLDGSRP